MRRIYFWAAIIGFVIPNILVAKISIETGNILLYGDIPTTFTSMFANDISTVFIIDLLLVVFFFMAWSYKEAKRYQMKELWWTWLLTFAFGLAGGLPLFLYWREGYKQA